MWEALIPTLFTVLKEHFDNIIMRVTTWFLSFIVCWLYIPVDVQLYLQVNSLPGLPDYILIYLFYFTASTCAWQAYLILIDTMGLLIEKFLKRKAVNPQSKWVEIDGEYKNYTFFKCHRLSLLFRIRKPSAPSVD